MGLIGIMTDAFLFQAALKLLNLVCMKGNIVASCSHALKQTKRVQD